MCQFGKIAVLSVTILLGVPIAANSDPLHPQPSGEQLSAVTVPRTELPTVTVWAPSAYYYDPYAGGASQCASGTSPGGALKCVDIIPLSHPIPLSQPIH